MQYDTLIMNTSENNVFCMDKKHLLLLLETVISGKTNHCNVYTQVLLSLLI